MHPIRIHVCTQKKAASYLLKAGNKESVVLYACEAACVRVVWIKNGWQFMVQEHPQAISALHQKQALPGFRCVVQMAELTVMFWVEEAVQGCLRYDGYVLDQKEIGLGRDTSLAVCIHDSFISMHHAVLRKTKSSWQLLDTNSTNGCYVNGNRVCEAIVQPGDQIQLGMVVLIMGKDSLFLPQHASLQTQLSPLDIKQTTHVESKKTSHAVWHRYEPFAALKQEVELPPAKPSLESTPAIFVLGPSITMGLSSTAMGLFSFWLAKERGQDLMAVIPTLLMSCSMALGTIVWPMLSKRYEKRQRIRKEEQRRYMYSCYLQELKERIHNAMKQEAIHRRHRYPSSSQLVGDIVQGKEHHQRRWKDEDWLHVVVGTGCCLAQIKLSFPHISSMTQDPLIEKLQTLQAKEWKLEDVSIVVDIKQYHRLCLVGDRQTCCSWLLDLLVQLAIWQSDRYTRFCILAGKELLSREKLFALAHVFVGEERLLIWDGASAKHSQCLLDVLFRDSQVHELLIFVLEPSLRDYVEMLCEKQKDKVHILEWSEEVSAGADLQLLVHQGNVTWENEKANFVPNSCAAEARREALLCVSQHALSASMHQQRNHGFLDMFGCSCIEDLHVLDRWQQSDVSESLRTPIGYDMQGELLYLDAHERSHGPHGLVAGMTGSGKSECLLTYLLSLALTYSWQDVNFLLIDFKGGTMANALASLPHTAGVLTNLDKGILSRSLTAIEAELTRRQQLFASIEKQWHISSMDIDKYQRLRKQHPSLEMLPHLFLVADEFAQLKQLYPQFLDQLRQCARIGRSLGIHLVLATQKPFGVVDEQIWSNARFHLCLKVADRNDSMDMLKKEDAMHLRHPGECLLQVGHDEVFQRGMAAWSQAPYMPTAHSTPIQELSYFGDDGSVQTMQFFPHNGVYKTQLEMVCDAICAQGDERTHSLCLPPLPKKLYMEDLPVETDGLCMGLIDDVAHQRQIPFVLSFTQGRNFAVCGMVGSGKSQFVETLVQHCLHKDAGSLYLFDFDKPLFAKYEAYAATAAVFQRDDAERIQSFFTFMKRMLRQRRKHSDPRILLCILHNYEAFHEWYGDWEEDLLYLLREGKKYGLLFCITTSVLSQIPMRVQSQIEDWFLLQCAHAEDYRYVFGHEQTCVPLSQPGCGILRYQESICMFQTAIYASNIWQPQRHAETPKQYCIPILPKRVMHAVQLDERGIFLGMDIQSKEEIFWPLRENSVLFLLSAYRFHDAFMALLVRHLQTHRVHLFSTQPLYGLQPQPLDALSAICEASQVQLLLWHCLDALAMEEAWMQHLLQQPHLIHLFVETMPHFAHYSNWEWFAPVWMDADVIWMGKGYSDYAYTLKKHLPWDQRLQQQEAYYWEEESCRIVRLWEVEENG